MIRWASKRSIHWGAGVAILLSAGCESITEKITEKAMEVAVESALEKNSGGEVDIETGKGVSFKSKDGKGGDFVVSSATGKVPESWPQDIPPYPGATVTASMSSAGSGMLMLETADSAEKVLAFYKSKLVSMKETANMNAGGTSILTFQEDKSGRQLAVGATAQQGKTMINLQVSEKAK
jgi:hypothetical protein